MPLSEYNNQCRGRGLFQASNMVADLLENFKLICTLYSKVIISIFPLPIPFTCKRGSELNCESLIYYILSKNI